MPYFKNKIIAFFVALICLSASNASSTASIGHIPLVPNTYAEGSTASYAELNQLLSSAGYTKEQKVAFLNGLIANATDLSSTAKQMLASINAPASASTSGATSGALPLDLDMINANYPGEFNTAGMISCTESARKDPSNTVCEITRASTYPSNRDYLTFLDKCRSEFIYFIPYKNGAVAGRPGEFLCRNGFGDMTYQGKYQKTNSKTGGTPMYATVDDLDCTTIAKAVEGTDGTKILYYLDGTLTAPKCVPPAPNSGFGGMCPSEDPKPKPYYKINMAAIEKMNPQLCQSFRMRSSINLLFLSNTSVVYDTSWTDADFCSKNAHGSCGTSPTKVEKVMKLGTSDLCQSDAKLSTAALSCITLDDSYNNSSTCAHSLSRQIQKLCGYTPAQTSDKMCNGNVR